MKILFLILWVATHSDSVDFSYLQYPDERNYIDRGGVLDSYGSFIVGQLYYVVVAVFKLLGFSIVDIKFFNMLLFSYAIARMVSFIDFNKDGANRSLLELVLFSLCFIPSVYYSIFILKEAFVFSLLVELYIALSVKEYRNYLLLFCLFVLLVMFRKTMLVFSLVLLFDRHYCLSLKRSVSLICVVTLFFLVNQPFVTEYFLKFYSWGLRSEIGVPISMVNYVEMKQLALDSLGGSLMYKVFYNNFKEAFLWGWSDGVTVILMKVSQLIIMVCFLYRMRKRNFFLVPGAYALLGILTMYNIRYNMVFIGGFVCSYFSVKRRS